MGFGNKGPQVKVVTVKGDKDARKAIEKMMKDGWTLQDQSSRRQIMSMHHGASLLLPGAALLTGKQKHTLTFVK